MVQRGELGLLTTLILLAAMVLIVGAIVFVERGQRRIPVQYAKRVVGRRMYGVLTIREKWEKHLGPLNSWLTEDYLSRLHWVTELSTGRRWYYLKAEDTFVRQWISGYRSPLPWTPPSRPAADPMARALTYHRPFVVPSCRAF